MVDSKRVLVTGGAGFVGANLVRQMLDAGYQITVLDNLSAGRREYLDGLDVELVQGDVLEADLVRRLVSRNDAVVHLAAQTGVPGSLEDPKRDCQVNVFGTLNVLEGARTSLAQGHSVKAIVASSNAPLGRQEPPATEDKAPLPISPYGASKLAAEGYCLAYHGSWGVPTVALRFANLYGPFSGHKGSVVAEFAGRMLAGKPITVDGDGGQTRDFIYVGDLCRAVQVAVESDVGGEIFQIATGVETSITELVELMQKTVGSGVEVTHGPTRQGDIRSNYSVISKAERVLGWRPEVSLEEGLRQTLDWFRCQAEETRADEGQGGQMTESDFMPEEDADEVARRLRALGYL